MTSNKVLWLWNDENNKFNSFTKCLFIYIFHTVYSYDYLFYDVLFNIEHFGVPLNTFSDQIMLNIICKVQTYQVSSSEINVKSIRCEGTQAPQYIFFF